MSDGKTMLYRIANDDNKAAKGAGYVISAGAVSFDGIAADFITTTDVDQAVADGWHMKPGDAIEAEANRLEAENKALKADAAKTSGKKGKRK